MVTGFIASRSGEWHCHHRVYGRGREGEFYTMTQRALRLQQQNAELTDRDYRLHFFPWWADDGYSLTGEGRQGRTERKARPAIFR